MKRLTLMILLGAFVLHVYAIGVEEIIAKTIENYENMTTLYVEFTNVLCDEATGTCSNASGVIYFKKPDLFRMEMNTPEQIYIGNSSVLWIYIPAEERAIKQNMAELPFQVNPDMFLHDYDERFTATLDKETEDTYRISLTPRDSTDLYECIAVEIDKKEYKIVGIAVTDEIGSENKYSFQNVQLNGKLSKKLFEFKPPAGVRVDEY